jgi:hypothetical protein
MLALCITAVVAFSLGFCAAAWFVQGRRQDAGRGESLLARTVASFSELHADRRYDVAGRVFVDRSQLDELDRALELRDELFSA